MSEEKAACGNKSGFVEKEEFQRLPLNVKPIHYELVFTPSFKTFTFDGYVDISVSILEATKTISLNAAELTFGAASVRIGQCDSKHHATVSVVDSKELVVFTFADELPLGNAVLSIDFKGILNDKLRGFCEL